MSKAIEASGHLHVGPVPKDGECDQEAEVERTQRKAREQFVSSTDKDTANRIIETSVILVAEFGAKGGAPLERAAAGVVDAMMDDFAELNNIAGTLISSKEELDTFIKGLRSPSGKGRRQGSTLTRFLNSRRCMLKPMNRLK